MQFLRQTETSGPVFEERRKWEVVRIPHTVCAGKKDCLQYEILEEKEMASHSLCLHGNSSHLSVLFYCSRCKKKKKKIFGVSGRVNVVVGNIYILTLVGYGWHPFITLGWGVGWGGGESA